MKYYYFTVLVSIILMGCSKPIYLVGIDPDPQKPTRVFYIPVVDKQVSKEEIDTTQKTVDKIFKVLSASLIKDFESPINIQETNIKSTGPNFSYQYADWDGDGIKDLFAINRTGFTASDIYILSGATGFQGFLLQQPIGIPKSDSHTDFSVADANSDGSQDLFVFERQVNENVKLTILSGKVSSIAPAFMHKLYETTLVFSDPNTSKTFKIYDIDKDKLPDLVVIDKEFRSTNGKMETKVMVYSGVSEFKGIIFNSITPIHSSCTNCSFVMDEFLVDNTLDLISIDDSNPERTKIDVLSGANNFLGFIKQDTLKLDASFRDAVFFSDDKLLQTNGSTQGMQKVFTPKPILKNLSGPQNLHNFVGEWELNSSFHSNDHNSRTGILIQKRTLEGKLSEDGWKGISIAFEDGFTITCEGKDGNLVCSDNYSISSVHHDYFYLVDEIGNHDKIERYIENINSGFLIFHNSSAYDAHIWGTWSEVGFGGKEKNVTTDKFYLSLAGGLNAMDIHDEHVFAIPKSAKNVRLYIDPVDGLDNIISISNPPIDNSCYRIRGDLLSAAFSSNYNYYDRDCTGSSNSRRQASAIIFQNSDLFSVLSSRIKKLTNDGFFSALHPNQPGLHETIKNEIFNVQVKEAIGKHNNTFDDVTNNTSFSVNSYSLGMGGGFEIIAGYSGDGGWVYDDETKLKRSYSSNGVSFGVEAGANFSIVIGLWKDHVSKMKSGWSWGGGAGVALIAGASVIGWTPELGSEETSGITISIDFGAEGKAVEYLYSNTSLGPVGPY